MRHRLACLHGAVLAASSRGPASNIVVSTARHSVLTLRRSLGRRHYSSIVLSDPFLAYQSLVQAEHLRPDECQLRAAKELQKLYRRIEDYRPPIDISRKIRQVEKALRNRQSRNPIRQILTNDRDRSLVRQLSWEDELLSIDTPRGLMLSGSVGTGKSMLIDTLLPMKRRWHYNALMLELFHRLNRERDDEFILLRIAHELIAESPILAIDEFQLGDAASARILKGVLIYFWKMGGVLIATSNRMPDDLYSGSFQAEQYRSFTELLSTRCVVHDMRSARDFRREADTDDGALQYYFSPEHDVASLEALVADLLPEELAAASEHTVYGRTIRVARQAGGVAHFTFADLCETDLGPADYITLASNYHTFVLDAVPVLTLAKKNEARRFISLLDALYEARCRLVLRAHALPDGLFFPDAATATDEGAAADSIASEAFSDTFYDLAQPNRPNISAYVDEGREVDDDTPVRTRAPKLAPSAADYNDMSTSPDLLYRERHFPADSAASPQAGRAPAAVAGVRRAGSRGEELAPDQARDFSRLNAFTGADEQFAFRRAASRLHEMTGRRWHARSLEGIHNADPDAAGALLRPAAATAAASVAARNVEQALDGVFEPSATTAEDTPASTDRSSRSNADGKPVQTLSPFRTHPEAPPKFSFEHFWNMVQRGGERKPTNPDDWKR